MAAPPRVAGMVVLYAPGAEVLENIRSYVDQVEVLYAVDNSERPDASLVTDLQRIPSVHYVPNGRNLGVAGALNVGARRAGRDGYDWLLTMDQDSTATPGMVAAMLTCLAQPGADSVGLVSPLHVQVGGKQPQMKGRCAEVLTAMTSGNLVRLSAYAVVGPFMDELFIDRVDNEFCLRLRAAGFVVWEAGEAVLTHQVGEVRRHRFPVPMYTTNHSPLRRYYMTRNRLYVGNLYRRQFPEYRRLELREMVKETIKILLHEKQKMHKLWMMWLGFRDYRRGVLGAYSLRNRREADRLEGL